jgi:alpha/beta hydrolase fold
MDTLRPLGRGVVEVIGPTYEAYGELLRQSKNAAAIHATQCETVTYGSHDRQKLDLYTPSIHAPKPAQHRHILVFAYGGGFISGDKIVAGIPGGVVYANLGYFFAEKCGFETIVMDYRLLGHGAKYPSGGEDIDGVMRWIQSRYGSEERNVFLMGNSAGGVHVATWLYDETFAARRQAWTTGKSLKLGGAVLLGAPFRLDPNGGMKDMLKRYYGDSTQIKGAEPTALMEHSTSKHPEVLVVVSELDPEFIVEASKEFVRLLQSRGKDGNFIELKGHNHISPPLSLGTGIEQEEAWGFEVARWMTESAVSALTF